MGRRANRKKTRKIKMQAARLVACGRRMNGIIETKIDYKALSPIGQKALDNVVQITGRSRDEIIESV